MRNNQNGLVKIRFRGTTHHIIVENGRISKVLIPGSKPRNIRHNLNSQEFREVVDKTATKIMMGRIKTI